MRNTDSTRILRIRVVERDLAHRAIQAPIRLTSADVAYGRIVAVARRVADEGAPNVETALRKAVRLLIDQLLLIEKEKETK